MNAVSKNITKSITMNIDYFYKYGLYIVFTLIVVTLSILTPKFYEPENIKHIFLYSAPLGIAVIGVSFVIVTQGIDFSTGTVMFLSAVMTTLLINNGAGLVPVLLAAVACGVFVGCINGLLISTFKVIPFIATLATMTFGRGLTLSFSKQQTLYMGGEIGDFALKTRVLGIPLIVFVLVALAVIGQLILSQTSFGRQLYAIGNNAVAAGKIGIKVKSKIFIVYIISGSFAGLSGLVSALQTGAVTPVLGDGFQFVITSAAVLGGVSLFGGRGKILPGALIGVLLITIIENGLVLMNANPYAYTVVRGMVIFFAVMIDCVRNKYELK